MTNWTTHLQAAGARGLDERWIDFGDPNQAQQPNDATLLTPLLHLAILEIEGADAKRLLQGQTSAQLELADGNFAPLTAFCSVKGRMLANAQLLCLAEDRYWLLLDRDLVEPLKSHLSKFAVFYKAQIRPRDDLALIGLVGRDAPALLEARLDMLPPAVWHQTMQGERVLLHHPGPRPRFILGLPQAEAATLWDTLARSATPVGNAVWQLQDIKAGLAWLNAAQQDTYLPQMINWEALGGISFKKGCYTGQEVVARAHFRGQVKKRMMRAQLEGSEVPETGAPICNVEGKRQGEVVSAALDAYGQAEILAVLNTRASEETLEVIGQRLKRLKLPYAIERLDPEELAAQG
ncbi:YgfZ/GcvT domain-containing protein [Halomonas sp. M20]|uniref:CAF17-like 4Fe-4S cluster assembly/insertion protein YgfZ n=1 Tax=Halomonas sp. M20 TaxID=2763264 RepID=UPI001D0ADB78|nr:folate-binding protein [Halomonas sp. M20]